MKPIHVNLAAAGLLLAAVFVIARNIHSPTATNFTQSDTAPADAAANLPVFRHRAADRGGDSSRITDRPVADSRRALRPSSATDKEFRPSPTSSQAKQRHEQSQRPAGGSSSHNLSEATAISNESSLIASNSSLESIPALLPAVFIDFDDPVVSQPEARERLAGIAKDFTDSVSQSALEPTSPQYRRIWDREAATADRRFRAMYGGHAWMSHHIQSHHAFIKQP